LAHIGRFCCVCVAFVYFFIYETKGLSLEQVDELYAKIPQARNSSGFVPTVSFVDVKDEISSGDVRRATLADLEQSAVRRKSSAGVHHEYEKA
jgi:SP family sugar:H+ symporter-like MFS transporter